MDYDSEDPVDITVYLPDEIGQRAKKEELKLSRMLRDAVVKELESRDAMNASLKEIETYEVEVQDEDSGLIYTGRITGRRIVGDEEIGIYLTSDKRVIAYLRRAMSYERIDDPPEDLVKNLKGWLESDPAEFVEACHALGIRPVIDL